MHIHVEHADARTHANACARARTHAQTNAARTRTKELHRSLPRASDWRWRQTLGVDAWLVQAARLLRPWHVLACTSTCAHMSCKRTRTRMFTGYRRALGMGKLYHPGNPPRDDGALSWSDPSRYSQEGQTPNLPGSADASTVPSALSWQQRWDSQIRLDGCITGEPGGSYCEINGTVGPDDHLMQVAH